jgi:glutamate 5-kinase
MSNYSNEETSRILGMKSSEIDSVLGYSYGDEVIHHNNLVLF